ncbi:hypothetical protein AX16_002383 [Volvariella volvacea WC 439]|nr:hypothetical protein AX16_002383 [Volvariella volvacea WC 439]
MDSEAEDAFRVSILELLVKAHALGGMEDFSFETVDSRYADFAFEMECKAFKWRWEANFLGYKRSAELISKHLIYPLISVNHLAFSSPDAVSTQIDTDVEKAVDKVGRTARRTVDTHIKHALSKPLVATTLRRMTALFNFTSELPAISSTAEKPALEADIQLPKLHNTRSSPRKLSTPPPLETKPQEQHIRASPSSLPLKSGGLQAESATESEQESDHVREEPTDLPAVAPTPSLRGIDDDEGANLQPGPSHVSVADIHKASDGSQSSASSPARPAKKAKKHTFSSSDDDTDGVQRPTAQSRGMPVKRGARQPIKRGGKRF